jgi:hypothetical protein
MVHRLSQAIVHGIGNERVNISFDLHNNHSISLTVGRLALKPPGAARRKRLLLEEKLAFARYEQMTDVV